MTIEIGEKTIGMWCVELPPAMQGNLLAHMGYLPDGRIRIDMRFRWYRDDLIGEDSKDARSWYRLDTKDPVALAIEKFRGVVERYRQILEGASTWELLRGARSAQEFAEALAAMPGMHVGEPVSDEQLADNRLREGLEELGEGPLRPEAPR